MDVRINTMRLGSFATLDADRSGFQRRFVELVTGDLGPDGLGRFLDIGCGGGLPDYLAPIGARVAEYHGLDPSPDVHRHPLATRKFHGGIESVANLPTDFYDVAMAYNVLEHIREGRPFFERVHAILRPGGRFWALTPHGRHPFAMLSNLVRVASLKRAYRRNVLSDGVNEYASYYRVNSPRAITRAIDGLGFSSAEFWLVPNVQWDTYVPRPLRFAARGYDRAIGSRFGAGMLLLIARLTK